MDKTIKKNDALKIQEAWNLCKRLTDLLALIGAAIDVNLPVPIEYYRLLDLKSQTFISYVKDLLDYAEDRDNQ